MPDDVSLLTAYLDGELDPRGRLEVESALVSNPRLADELHELIAVRDLLAGLPRPEPSRDLAEEVVARIGRRRLRTRWASRAAFFSAIAAAAAILIVAPLGWPGITRPPVKRLAQALEVVQGGTDSAKIPERPLSVAEVEEHDRPEVVEVPKAPPEVRRVVARDDDPAAQAREVDQQHIRKLLDSPNLRRIFVVTDVLGGDASHRLGTLLQQTPRGEPRYGRITISQGIVIDPKHPDEATVFALVLDDRELGQLQAKLAETFPNAVEESIAEPSVVTQLADIGQVAVLSGVRAADLTFPATIPSRLALRTEAKEKPLERSRLSPGADLEEVANAASPGSGDFRRRGKAARVLEGPGRPQGQSATPGTPLEEKETASLPVASRPESASPEVETASRGSSPGDREPSTLDKGQEHPGSLATSGGGGGAGAKSRGEPSIVLVWVTTGGRRGGDTPPGGTGGRTLGPRDAGG